MPRIQRNGSVVVEVSSSLFSLSRIMGDADEHESCFLCAHEFCPTEECTRALMPLECCNKAICCGCAVKIASLCTCKDDCDAVIAPCPFCRKLIRMHAADLFCGTRPVCKACVKIEATPPTHAPGMPATLQGEPQTPAGDQPDP